MKGVIMSKATVTEEKNNNSYPGGVPEGLMDEMADDLLEEEEVEEPAAAEVQEAARSVAQTL
jgi:hypothetical protein